MVGGLLMVENSRAEFKAQSDPELYGNGGF